MKVEVGWGKYFILKKFLKNNFVKMKMKLMKLSENFFLKNFLFFF